jgi:hypothetical protein
MIYRAQQIREYSFVMKDQSNDIREKKEKKKKLTAHVRHVATTARDQIAL